MPMLILWRGDERAPRSHPSGLERVAAWSALLGCVALFGYSVLMWVTG